MWGKMKQIKINENDFFAFIKKNLNNFLAENRLGVVNEYKDWVIKTTLNKHEQEVSYYSVNDLRKIYFGNNGYSFIKYLLNNANEDQKFAVLSDAYDFFNYEHLIAANYKNIENLKIVFAHLGKGILKHYSFQNIIESMQSNYSSEDYDVLIDIFLSNKTKELQNKNNKIIMNLILNKIKSNEIYEKYNSLIPNNEINDDFFEDLHIVCFDLNVSKDKLYSSISLKNKDKYNDMHEFLLTKLNDEKLKDLIDLISIDGELKFKSSKYYRYIFRIKENGLLDQDKAKMLIIATCKLYAKTVNNIPEGEYEYKTLNNISSETIYNNYLQYRLAQENKNVAQNKEKKIKI